MKVLDLFCGLKGFSQAFIDRGHNVVTVDILSKFNPTIVANVMDLNPQDFEKYGQFDVILASPPCNCFSVASIGKHWKGNKPDEETKKAIKLVAHTLYLILNLHPRFWFLENPMGMLRKVLGKPQKHTAFAYWGEYRKKPTDIWGVIPKAMKWNTHGFWEKASRGSRKGTQGVKSTEERAKIPYNLSLAICIACEKELRK